MQLYNKIMLYFWLATAILITLVVTIMGIKDGFDVWAYYYVFSGIATLAYLSRHFMMKRFARNHEEFYKNNETESNEK